jgi:hypothetical protein
MTLELLRPPAHRAPLIAAGAVVLAAGVLLTQLRLEGPVGDGIHLAYTGLAAALVLALGLLARPGDDGPEASQSVLLVTGLVLLAIALVRLADVLGAGGQGYPSGAVVWGSLALGAVALAAGVRCRSGICVFIAAGAGVVALLHAIDWIAEPDTASPYRIALLALAVACVLGSLGLRGRRYRDSVLLVGLAGLLIAALGLSLIGTGGLAGAGNVDGPEAGTGWELVLLVAACGLIAFGAVDRQPGPAYLGVLDLLLFVLLAVQTGGRETGLWWPALLLALGGGVMAAGLRPRTPLPPEPPAYGTGDLPLASRTSDDDDAVVRVRIDD